MVSVLRSAARPPVIGILFLAVLTTGASILLLRPEPTKAGGTVITVTNADDPGNGDCFVNGCTLREAIDLANGSQGNTIAFALPGCPDAPANCVIQLGSALPALSQLGTRIDGTTQPGYPGAPVVTIDGTGLGPGVSGLTVNAFFVGIKGLTIRDFPGSGIDATAFFLDGLAFTDNQIVNNDGDGISLGPGFNGVGPVGHEIARNTISDNGGTGINNSTNCMDNTRIISNTITGHTGAGKAGIEICGANDIHFNRITGNFVGIRDHGFSSISAAENNWWGCNEGPTNSDCDSSDESDGAADYDPWLVLTFNASPDTIFTGETSTLAANLNMNSDGADTLGDGHLPDSTGILFQTDLGNVGSKSVTVGMVSGQASATLHADEGPGTAHVSAELDKETQNDQVTIMEAPTPTPTATPSPTPTETPTPTPTPTATPTPTPTATPAPELTQGDVDCNGSVSSVDALKELRHVANLLVSQTLPCPEIGTDTASIWGDVDCSGQVTSVDALKILRHVASLPVIQNEPCPDIGDREN